MKIHQRIKENGAPLLALLALTLLAAAFRWAFVAGTELSEFDPWRHLQLLNNIRYGAGFTLFDGQPYIWYNRIWYCLAAMLGGAGMVQWVSCWLSVLALSFFFLFLLRSEKSLETALAGGVMMAAFGPVIAFSSTYGAESLALCLVMATFLLATYQSRFPVVFLGGLLFGVAIVSRINFIFNCFIILPFLKSRRNYLLFFSGMAIVPCLAWWDNHQVIGRYTYLFTWDGLATRSSDYGIAATLVPQLHPAVVRATRTLYEQIAPIPFDLYYRGGIAWGNLFFLTAGVAGIALSKRFSLILAGLLPLVYFTFFDKTLSTNFFRHYLAVFPAFFIGIALSVRHIRQSGKIPAGLASLLSFVLVVAVIVSGSRYLRPQRMIKLETATPPPTLLTKDRYMVNSGFYHPESLAYRYPDKKFIGMPIDPGEFDDFARHYPDYSTILWHKRFSVQNDLLRYLTESGRYRIAETVRNDAGAVYLLLEPRGRLDRPGVPVRSNFLWP